MLKKATINYADFAEAVLSYMSWIYTASVLDKEKKICIKVEQNSASLAVKSSNILVRQTLDATTEGLDTKDSWFFILDFTALKKLTETYRNLVCTNIVTIGFEEADYGIKMNLLEVPKEGYPDSYRQIQTYEYPQIKINKNKYFGEMDGPNMAPMQVNKLSHWLDCLVPKMKSDNQIVFERDYTMLQSSSVIYCYKNPSKGIFEDGFAITQPESSFIRQVAKYTKNAVYCARNDNYIILSWGRSRAWLTKARVVRPIYTILQHEPYQWGMSVQGGYFEDMLRRYTHIENDAVMTIENPQLARLNGEGIQQNMVIQSNDKAVGNRLFITPKTMQGMILAKTNQINMGFLDKKSRGKATYCLCYMDGGPESDWLTITQLRKG